MKKQKRKQKKKKNIWQKFIEKCSSTKTYKKKALARCSAGIPFEKVERI